VKRLIYHGAEDTVLHDYSKNAAVNPAVGEGLQASASTMTSYDQSARPGKDTTSKDQGIGSEGWDTLAAGFIC